MASPVSLVAVESHPIQYKAPLFRALTADPRVDLTALYAMLPDAAAQGDGFGVAFEWDIPLLDGYRHELLENRAPQPSVTRFGGCDTPGVHAWLRRKRPDAVLVNGWVVKSCLQALAACRRLGIPCIVRGEANLLRPRAAWKHALHRVLLRGYSACAAIGSANREFYRFHHIPERRLFWAPYAVDNTRFEREAEARSGRQAELRAAFGLPADALVFLFAGKLEAKKRPLDLLRALGLLRERAGDRARLLVAGDGPLRAECEAYVQAHGLGVVFAGFLNQRQLPDAYAACDALVLPSDAGETWGLVVNEAMASGRPALVSQYAGCCRDLIREGETGYSFPCGDPAALADAMGRFLADPGLAARQGLEARAHIQSFGTAQAAEGLIQAAAWCRESRRGRAMPCT